MIGEDPLEIINILNNPIMVEQFLMIFSPISLITISFSFYSMAIKVVDCEVNASVNLRFPQEHPNHGLSHEYQVR
jgi:hypothetical protein